MKKSFSSEWFDRFLPNKMWFSLKDCCAMKNLSYKTSCNRTELQPNQGAHDCRIGGNRVWHRETVKEWMLQSDEDILT